MQPSQVCACLVAEPDLEVHRPASCRRRTAVIVRSSAINSSAACETPARWYTRHAASPRAWNSSWTPRYSSATRTDASTNPDKVSPGRRAASNSARSSGSTRTWGRTADLTTRVAFALRYPSARRWPRRKVGTWVVARPVCAVGGSVGSATQATGEDSHVLDRAGVRVLPVPELDPRSRRRSPNRESPAAGGLGAGRLPASQLPETAPTTRRHVRTRRGIGSRALLRPRGDRSAPLRGGLVPPLDEGCMSPEAGPDTRDCFGARDKDRGVDICLSVTSCSQVIPKCVALAVCVQAAYYLIQKPRAISGGQLEYLLREDFNRDGHG